MKAENERKKIKLPLRRKLIQLYAALLYNAYNKGFLTGNIYTGKGKMLCVPGLNCYSCPGAVGACPLGALQNALASSGKKAPYYMVGILLLFGITLGRTICGWLCPVGLVQELLHKIPTPKLPKNRLTGIFSYLKYIILILFVVILPIMYGLRDVPLPAFCKYICPAGTLGGAVMLLIHPDNADKFSMLGKFFTGKWAILMLIILSCVFIYRAFCRFLCPLGAIYGIFNRFALTGIRVNDEKCVRCGRCIANCPMDVKKLCDHECIQCGKCIAVCPVNAISLRAGKTVLWGDMKEAEEKEDLRKIGKTGRIISISAAVILLFFVFVGTNFIEGGTESRKEEGYEPGQVIRDFSIQTTGGEVFHLQDYRGKTVVINLWATWCTPCVNELPYFEQLSKAHSEDAVVLAIHSDLVTEDVEAYLASRDYHFNFAVDEQGEVIRALGGDTMLPQTIIINSNGIVTYNMTGSVTYEKLEQLMEEAE